MREKSAIKNATFVIVQKIIEIIFSFIFRTVLIKTLGTTYLGISGLFTNIFSLFSLMELGIGSSIVFLMYKPLLENDETTLKALLKLYAKFYNIIAIIITIIGICIIPFLNNIIKDYSMVSKTINIFPIYILTLLNVVSSYFFSYRRSLLEADQKSYINSFNYMVFNVIGTIIRIVILIITKNYIFCMLVAVTMNIISNIDIYIKTNKIYPYLKEKSNIKLAKEKTHELYIRMGAATMHQISNVIVTSTDNIIISMYIGVIQVGLYSNYVMITNMIYMLFSLIFSSITANVGNMKFSETSEKSEKIFNRLFFLNFYFYFISCVGLNTMINKFISIWLGKEYVFTTMLTFIIVFNLYITGMRHVVVTFINSSGLNYNTRYKSIIESVLNLVLSLILVRFIGISGVIIGTVLSFVLVSVWFEPYVLYKNWLGRNGLIKYYMKYILYISLTVTCMLVFNRVFNLLNCNNFVEVILQSCLVFSILNILIIIMFKNTGEFKYFFDMIKKMLSSFIEKGKKKNE
ncbi:MAG: oligosaccharide flippase family protein [Bacilli bacterium]